MVPCQPCNQSGQVTCGTCDGFRANLHYMLLTCDFEVKKSTHVVKYSKGLSDRIVTKASGMELLSFRAPGVEPIADFPEAAVNQISHQLVAQHHMYHGGSCRILMQEHKLDAVPIHEVRMQGDKPWTFWIIGNEKLVVVNQYPATCACTIS